MSFCHHIGFSHRNAFSKTSFEFKLFTEKLNFVSNILWENVQYDYMLVFVCKIAKTNAYAEIAVPTHTHRHRQTHTSPNSTEPSALSPHHRPHVLQPYRTYIHIVVVQNSVNILFDILILYKQMYFHVLFLMKTLKLENMTYYIFNYFMHKL